MKKSTAKFRKNLYELPYQIMQLEKDIEETQGKILEMKTKLRYLRRKEDTTYEQNSKV